MHQAVPSDEDAAVYQSNPAILFCRDQHLFDHSGFFLIPNTYLIPNTQYLIPNTQYPICNTYFFKCQYITDIPNRSPQSNNAVLYKSKMFYKVYMIYTFSYITQSNWLIICSVSTCISTASSFFCLIYWYCIIFALFLIADKARGFLKIKTDKNTSSKSNLRRIFLKYF